MVVKRAIPAWLSWQEMKRCVYVYLTPPLLLLHSDIFRACCVVGCGEERKTHFPTGHWIHITEHFIWQIKIHIEIPFWFIWSLRKVVGAEALGRTFRASLSKWVKNNFEILRQAKWALFVLQLWKSKKQFKWRLLMRHFNLKLLADVAIMQMCKINVSIV